MTLYLFKTIYLIQTSGFKYKGFDWYLAEAGASCDSTCRELGLSNDATEAGNIVQVGDCTIIEHFIPIRNGGGGTTLCWSFGHKKANSDSYYCTTYGSTTCGTQENSPDNVVSQTNQLTCACSPGKNLQGLQKRIY